MGQTFLGSSSDVNSLSLEPRSKAIGHDVVCLTKKCSDWSPRWVGDTFNAEKMCQYNYVDDGNVLIYAQ